MFREPNGREDPRRLVITEGQKKAEKAAQEGIGCVAVFGVWSWFVNFGGESVPVEALSRLEWSRYSVEICFDSDAATNPHIRRAELALARWLRNREVFKVAVIRLPAADDGSKVGLDDYLLNHSVDKFEALPRQEADEPQLEDAVEMLSRETGKRQRNETLARILVEEPDAAELERFLKTAARRTGISVVSIRKSAVVEAAQLREKQRDEEALLTPSVEELEKAREQRKATVDAILEDVQRSVTLRAQTWVRGQLAYVCALGAHRAVLLTGACEAVSVDELPQGLTVTEPPPNRSPISQGGICRFRAAESIRAREIFESLRNCFVRHAVFKYASVPTTLALWTMGTYLHVLFNYWVPVVYELRAFPRQVTGGEDAVHALLQRDGADHHSNPGDYIPRHGGKRRDFNTGRN